MYIRLLAVSLVLSVALAMIFVKVVLLLGLHDQLVYVIPLLPVFYAIIYPVVEKHRLAGIAGTGRSTAYVSLAPRGKPWNRRLPVIAAGAAASLLMHLVLATAAWLAADHAGIDRQHPWLGGFSLLHHLLRGDAVRFSGLRHAAFLGMDIVMMSAAGGLCVGLVSPSGALLNGLLAGVLVSVGLGVSQFEVLYGPLLTWSSQLSTAFQIGWKWYYGLSTGLLLQAFFFAVCSELAARLRPRAADASLPRR